jgi:hypothetical protein
MASVKIKTDVDTAAFKGFTDVFERFATTLGAQSDTWATIGARGGEAATIFGQAAAQTALMAESMADVVGHLSRFERSSNTTANHWLKLSRNTKDVATHIGNATVSLLRWASITGLVSGLLGGGALFGLSFLGGRGVADTRATALGTGTTYGGLQAFRTNFQRYGDADSFIDRLNDARRNPGPKQRGFGPLGISQHDLDTKDTSELGIQAFEGFKKWLDTQSVSTLGPNMSNTGLDQFFSGNQAQLIKDTPHDTTDQFGPEVRSLTKTTQVSDADQKQWTDFVAAMDRTGQNITTVFEQNLVKLTPGLDALSESFKNLLKESLKKGGPAEQWLGEVNTGLKWLADNIGTDDFRKHITNFIDDVVLVGGAIFAIAKGLTTFTNLLMDLGIGPRSGDKVKPLAPGESLGGAYTTLHAFGSQGDLGVGGSKRAGPHWWSGMLGEGGGGAHPLPGGFRGRTGIGGKLNPEVVAYIRAAAVKRGIDPDKAVAVAASEGLHNWDPNKPDHGGDSGTSFGPWQFHFKSNIPGQTSAGMGDDLLREKGIDARDPKNWRAETDYALDHAKKLGWGAWHGAQRIHMGNREGLDYRPPAASAAPARTTTVTLQKNTGGNPITSAAAMTAPQ